MTDYDSDDLRDLDLHAWDAPAAPKGLADTVIARMVGADEAIAVTIHKRRRSRAIVVAACAGTVAAGVAVWLGARSMRVTSDDFIVATQAERLDIGGATVDVEAGTTIRAHRTGGELHVVQAGAATWHVPADEHLVIDAGSSASIDATGASLRVETKMNMENPLVMSGVALSAAAIALVGATVYEGQAKLNEGSHVTVVGPSAAGPNEISISLQASATHKLEMLDETRSVMPVPLHPVDIWFAPGDSAVIYTHDDVGILFHSACDLIVHLVHVTPSGSAWHSIYGAARLRAGTYNYNATCDYGPPMNLTGRLEVRNTDDADRLVVLHDASPKHISGTAVAGTKLTFENVPVPVNSDNNFDVTLKADAPMAVVLRADNPRGTQYYVVRSIIDETTVPSSMPVQLDVGPPPTPARAANAGAVAPKPAPKCTDVTCAAESYAGACCAKFGTPQPNCDAEALIQAGTEATSVGDYKTALLEFAKAYGCKPEDRTRALAYMAACNSQNAGAARYFWRKMSEEDQNRYLVMCTRAGITRADLDAR